MPCIEFRFVCTPWGGVGEPGFAPLVCEPFGAGIWLGMPGSRDIASRVACSGGALELATGPGPPFLDDLNKKDMFGDCSSRN